MMQTIMIRVHEIKNRWVPLRCDLIQEQIREGTIPATEFEHLQM